MYIILFISMNDLIPSVNGGEIDMKGEIDRGGVRLIRGEFDSFEPRG